ncbi:hypothetical protein [Labedaea rhizosphaerae]|uniref:Uncharacterized protein n=1 Tax=Labedaea rhizosphaerae TaxID=598644 RepID=A0A4R6SPH1_LABRH|nr:hypothetical protein [Labedaea rhizosphaerae]TDQ05480.1 hypothetical protein EV186_1011451 [Labedaea rhizosphaerae]
MRRAALLAAAALALVLCGGCRADQATGPTSPADTSQFDQIDSTLASIEADVNQP